MLTMYLDLFSKIGVVNVIQKKQGTNFVLSLFPIFESVYQQVVIIFPLAPL